MQMIYITLSSPTKNLHPSASATMREIFDKVGDAAEYDIKTNTVKIHIPQDADLLTDILPLFQKSSHIKQSVL